MNKNRTDSGKFAVKSLSAIGEETETKKEKESNENILADKKKFQ